MPLPALDLVSAAASVSSTALQCDLGRPSNLSGLPFYLLEVVRNKEAERCWTSTTGKVPLDSETHLSVPASTLVHLANVFWATECARPGVEDTGMSKARKAHREETKRIQCDGAPDGWRHREGNLLLVLRGQGRLTLEGQSLSDLKLPYSVGRTAQVASPWRPGFLILILPDAHPVTATHQLRGSSALVPCSHQGSPEK